MIIQFRHAPSGADHQKVQARGGALRHEWQASHAAAYAVPTEAVSSLAADPDIAYISHDRAVQGSLDYSEETINATIALQAGISGKGIGVAILDSGITTVDDLNGTGKKATSRVVYRENFIDSSPDTCDQYGHGTHVAGVVAEMALIRQADVIPTPSMEWRRMFRSLICAYWIRTGQARTAESLKPSIARSA